MAKIKLLVDTDIFIDYFNTGRFSGLLESEEFTIYYSIVAKKELLSKKGLRDAERQAILHHLRGHRLIRLDPRIAERYSDLRRQYPSLEKEDAIVAATALIKNLPLVTRNWRHYRGIKGLTLFKGH